MSGNSRDPEIETFYQGVLSVVQDLSVQLGSVREQVRLDLADYLARYREDAYRATMALATRVTRIELQLEDDAKARTGRQRRLDKMLGLLLILMVILVFGVAVIAIRLWR